VRGLFNRPTGAASIVLEHLLGVIAFVVGCFLPFWELGLGLRPLNYNTSYFRMVVVEGGDAAGNVGGFLLLFGGPVVLAWIAIAGLRGSRSTGPALAAATVVWSLTWIGVLLGVSRLGNYTLGRDVGWWVLLLGVVVVVIGTIVTWISDRRAEAPAQQVDVTEG
jgi:hypothetical protein